VHNFTNRKIAKKSCGLNKLEQEVTDIYKFPTEDITSRPTQNPQVFRNIFFKLKIFSLKFCILAVLNCRGKWGVEPPTVFLTPVTHCQIMYWGSAIYFIHRPTIYIHHNFGRTPTIKKFNLDLIFYNSNTVFLEKKFPLKESHSQAEI